MKDKLLFYTVVMLFSVFISSVSQVLLKKSAQKKYEVWWREYLNLPVVTAYAVFFLSTLLTMYAYKGVPLTMGPIVEATGYFYVTFFGIRIFGEKLNRRKALALALILAGIVIYAVFGQV